MKMHGEGMALKAAKCQHEHEQYSRLLAADPKATYDHLWEILGRGDTVRKRIPKGFDFLPEEPLSLDEINVVPRSPQDVTVPEQVMMQVTGVLVDGYGVRPGLAESEVRITDHIQSLIFEHIALAEKHFQITESLVAYLTGRGVELTVSG